MTLDVVETMRQLQFIGRTLASDGKQLTVSGGGELSPELMESLRSHRDALIRIFTPPAVAGQQEAAVEREAIQWAERQPNAEADASLASAVAGWGGGQASAFATAAAKAFPGSRLRPLRQAEYDAIGFADSRATQAASPQESHKPAARRGEWLAIAFDIELRIRGELAVIHAGEGVRRIATLDEIADAFDRDSMKRAAELYEPKGMVAVWVRGVHPAFIEPEALGLAPSTSGEGDVE
jgi:hypothetical protein